MESSVRWNGRESAGAFITRGVSVDSLDRTKKWPTHITVKQGDYLHAGDIIAEVPETHAITHKCMVPPGIEGTVLVTVATESIPLMIFLSVYSSLTGIQKTLP